MKKTFLIMILLSIWIVVSAQIDTISINIYQNNGNLGIGTKIPTHSLQIRDSIDIGIERNLLLINNLSCDSSSYTGLILKTGQSNYQSVIQDYGISYSSPYYDLGGFLNLSNNSKGLMLHANSSDGIIKFYTGHDVIDGAGIERVRIDAAGNIGIGTDNPDIKLHIVDSNTQILLGYQPAYDGPYINIHGSPENEPGPMIAIGVANKVYYKFEDTLAMKNWAYLYGNNLNSGISILPDLQYASKGIYINRDGKIGINTKHPKVELDVNGGIMIGYSETNLPGIIRFTGNDFEGFNGTTWSSLTEISNNIWQVTNNEIYYNQGNVGIGTERPYAKLEITDGDIFISDIEKGIIMKSPDGGCWRGTLDNSGILNFVSIQCPDDTIVPGKSQEVILAQSVLIYPNPAKDKLNIEVKNNSEKVEYFVYNSSGKLVQNGYIRNYFKTINISDLERGVYMFEFKDLENNKIAVQKIIKN